MKRFALAGGLALACAITMLIAAVYAANITLTPIVPPTETGENSLGAQQVTDMARIKVGSGTVTSSGSTTAQTATLNFAAGVITTGALAIATSTTAGANAVITLTNSKVQAGDMVQCTVDATGATAGSLPMCASAQVSANTIAFTIVNVSNTALATGIKIYYLVNTQGNPN